MPWSLETPRQLENIFVGLRIKTRGGGLGGRRVPPPCRFAMIRIKTPFESWYGAGPEGPGAGVPALKTGGGPGASPQKKWENGGKGRGGKRKKVASLGLEHVSYILNQSTGLTIRLPSHTKVPKIAYLIGRKCLNFRPMMIAL